MSTKETISTTDEDGKVYEFEKPSFEIELFSVKVAGDRELSIFGAYKAGNEWYSIIFDIYGVCNEPSDQLSLTPIAKQWYEDENKSPYAVMLKDEKDGKYYINVLFWEDVSMPNFKEVINNGTCRLATKQERNSLHYDTQQ